MKRVTSPAHRPVSEPAQVKSVGLVARRTRKLACVKRGLRRGFIVAVGASSGNPCTSARVRIVATDTVSFAHHGMRRDHVLVTATASSVARGSHCMRFMATGAVAMFACLILCQDLRPLVTRGAAERSRRRKRVRLMATRTGIMPTRERRRCRNRRLFLPVTLHAGRCVRSKLMPPMAVCAGSTQA